MGKYPEQSENLFEPVFGGYKLVYFYYKNYVPKFGPKKLIIETMLHMYLGVSNIIFVKKLSFTLFQVFNVHVKKELSD